MIQSDKRFSNKAPLFYFRYQMRIQFIPYIEQEIHQFIDFCEAKLNQPQLINQIQTVAKKRIKDIDQFFNRNWNDYRVQQILRARSDLIQFFKRHHKEFSQQPPSQMKVQVENIKKSSYTQMKDEAQNSKTNSPISGKGQKRQTENIKKSPSIQVKVEVQTSIKNSPVLVKAQKKQVENMKRSPTVKNKAQVQIGKKSSPILTKQRKQKEQLTISMPPAILQPKNLFIKSSRQSKQVGTILTNRSNKQIKGLTILTGDNSPEKTKSSPRNPQSITPVGKLPDTPKITNQKKMTKEEFILYLRSKKIQK